MYHVLGIRYQNSVGVICIRHDLHGHCTCSWLLFTLWSYLPTLPSLSSCNSLPATSCR